MSRTFILSLATAAAIAAVSLGSGSADARGFGGGGFGGGHLGGGGHVGGGHAAARGSHLANLNPGRGGGGGGQPGGHWAGKFHHGHWIFRDGIWIEIDGVADVGPDVAPAPGPCTCLTKNYTPDGLVVFTDICTKESASAQVAGKAADATQLPATDGKAADATQTQVPSDYAGRTYQDYLAANPQASVQAQKN